MKNLGEKKPLMSEAFFWGWVKQTIIVFLLHTYVFNWSGDNTPITTAEASTYEADASNDGGSI